jgi:hypothetical protein
MSYEKKKKSNRRRMIGVNNDAQYPASRHVHKSGEKFQAPCAAAGFSPSAIGGEKSCSADRA